MIDRIALAILIAVVIALSVVLAVFVAAYGRLPMGSGEMWNWLFGWGHGK